MASTDSACETFTVIGQKFITNCKYTERNADLFGGTVNAPVVGYRPDNNSPNQKFTFEPQATEGHVKISVVPYHAGKLYLASVDPSPGDKIHGVEGGVASVYTLHTDDEGQVKLAIKCGDDDTDLYWTLNSVDDNITLERDNHSPNQLWGFADQTSVPK